MVMNYLTAQQFFIPIYSKEYVSAETPYIGKAASWPVELPVDEVVFCSKKSCTEAVRKKLQGRDVGGSSL